MGVAAKATLSGKPLQKLLIDWLIDWFTSLCTLNKNKWNSVPTDNFYATEKLWFRHILATVHKVPRQSESRCASNIKDTDLKWSFSQEIDASLCPRPGCVCGSVWLVPCASYQDTIMSQHPYRQSSSGRRRAGTPPKHQTSPITGCSGYSWTNKHSMTSRWPWGHDSDIGTTCTQQRSPSNDLCRWAVSLYDLPVRRHHISQKWTNTGHLWSCCKSYTLHWLPITMTIQ